MKEMLIKAHKALVMTGKYNDAWLVLKLLRNKVLRLGLNSDSASLEILLDGMGMTPRYSRDYSVATYTLN